MDDHTREVMESCQRGLERWQRYVSSCSDEEIERDTIRSVVESARRQGIPVVRGEMQAGVVVLEIVAPRGHG